MRTPHLLLVGLALAGACSAPGGEQPAEPLRLDPGFQLPESGSLDLSGDLVVPAGDYLRSADEGGLIVLRGLRGVTLDLRGVHLVGAAPESEPSDFRGRAVVVEGCTGVRVLGGHLAGYRVGLWIENCTDVLVEGLRVDPASGVRLDSAGGPALVEEPLADRVGRWGAGIVVVESAEVTLRELWVRGGALGVAGIGLDRCRLESSDLSYLSAHGVALERASGCEVLGNRCDRVRRGQGAGAASIWLGPGCAGNRVCGNLLRGGELGGQDLGGNGNRWAWNDLSECEGAALRLEAVRDAWVLGNRVEGGAGLWIEAGEGVVLAGNRLTGVRGPALGLSGGASPVVADNELVGGDLGLELGGVAGAWVGGNRFEGNLQDLVLEDLGGAEFWRNEFEPELPRPHLDGLVAEGGLEGRAAWGMVADGDGDLPSGRAVRSQLSWARPEAPIELGRARGWRGPTGHGAVPSGSPLEADPWLGAHGPWDPESGTPRPLAAPRGPLAGVTWRATWFAWDEGSDPRGDLDRWLSRRFDAPVRGEVRSWTDPWGGDPDRRSALPAERFGLVASTDLRIDHAGPHRLWVRSDDGYRLRLDGEVVLEDWSWHPARLDRIELELDPGPHRLELEYFQVDGPAVLELGLEPRDDGQRDLRSRDRVR